jgi:putative ABC transport system substrate-binding protein
VARVGVLGIANSSIADEQFNALKQGLAALGYSEGQTIIYDLRDAHDSASALDLAHELVQLPVDVIVAYGSVEALPAREATTTIPIIFVGVTDPVGIGLVESIAHPGGNVTGIPNVPVTVVGKNLEHLARLIPGLSRVATFQPFDPVSAALEAVILKAATSAAETVGVEVKALAVDSADDVERALAEALAWPAQAVLVFTDNGVVVAAVPRLLEFQMQHRIPVVFNNAPDGQTRGGLLSYIASTTEYGRLAASLVDRVLKGANPGNLPVEQPTVYDFVINQRVAKALGISIPPEVAQEVTQWDQ